MATPKKRPKQKLDPKPEPHTGDPLPALQRAAKALPNKPADALEALLEAWQIRRVDDIANLVSRASTVTARGRPTITGTNHTELQEAWLTIERAGDPADLDRLLDALFLGQCAESIKRIERLAARPDDPRTRDALVGAIMGDPTAPQVTSLMMRSSSIPFTSKPNRAFWTKHLLPLLARLGDATVVARLRERRRENWPTGFLRWLSDWIGRHIPMFDERTGIPLGEPERAAIEAVTKALDKIDASTAGSAQTADALYAEVWASPDDDGPRAVLADFLEEHGDPRGEFITLQLARHRGTITSDGKKREKELLKRHKREWLGPIAPLMQPYNIRFERGFIVTCQLEPDAELEKTLGSHPAWSTIREYLIHGYSISKGEGKQLVTLLESHGATASNTGRFKRGIE